MFPFTGRNSGARFCVRREPRLSEMIDDPIVRAVMDADGIGIGELRKILTDAMTVYDAPTARLASRPQQATERC